MKDTKRILLVNSEALAKQAQTLSTLLRRLSVSAIVISEDALTKVDLANSVIVRLAEESSTARDVKLPSTQLPEEITMLINDTSSYSDAIQKIVRVATAGKMVRVGMPDKETTQVMIRRDRGRPLLIADPWVIRQEEDSIRDRGIFSCFWGNPNRYVELIAKDQLDIAIVSRYQLEASDYFSQVKVYEQLLSPVKRKAVALANIEVHGSHALNNYTRFLTEDRIIRVATTEDLAAYVDNTMKGSYGELNIVVLSCADPITLLDRNIVDIAVVSATAEEIKLLAREFEVCETLLTEEFLIINKRD